MNTQSGKNDGLQKIWVVNDTKTGDDAMTMPVTNQ
jgi:hypothetical protein